MAETLFVDHAAPGDPGPGDSLVSDPREDGSLDHPFDTIQEAIDAAAIGDEVVVFSGTYCGAGNVNVDFLGKAITVRSLSGPEVTIVDCEGVTETRGFVFQTNEHRESVLDGFTITNGNMSGVTPGQQRGAAIYCQLAGPTIRQCVLTGNEAVQGGGSGERRGRSPDREHADQPECLNRRWRRSVQRGRLLHDDK